MRRLLVAIVLLCAVDVGTASAHEPGSGTKVRSNFSQALLLNPLTQHWRRLGFPGAAVACQTVVALSDGHVLVAGGVTPRGVAVNSTFLYDPRTTRWRPVGDLHVARCSASGVALSDDGALVVGGDTPGSGHRAKVLTSVEHFDAKQLRWRKVASLPYPLVGQTATRLKNGDVLEVGGLFQGSALQYDVTHDRWIATAVAPFAGVGLTATTLDDGRVLVVGTITRSPLDPPRQSALLFDPVRTWWTPLSLPGPRRAWQTATLLRGGRVLVVGGFGAGADCELFDPASLKWSPAASLTSGRFMHSATVLANGQVLVAAGLADDPAQPALLRSTEIYDPLANSWQLGPSLPTGQSRRSPTAILLPGKNVLFLGGSPNNRPSFSVTDSAVSV